MSNTAFSKMATSSGAVRHGCWARNAIPLLSSLGAKGQPECNKLGRPKYSPPQGEQQCMPPMLLNAPRTEQRRRSRRGKILERLRPGRSRFQRGDAFRWPEGRGPATAKPRIISAYSSTCSDMASASSTSTPR